MKARNFREDKLYNQVKQQEERVIIVGLNYLQTGYDDDEAERSLAELAELVTAAGGNVLASARQNRNTPDATWYIGKGKLNEISSLAAQIDASTLVFDDELSGSQIRNIEDFTGLKILDRTFVILDIFAKRARTKEGKLQVELAQLQYRLSRLVGLGKALSRLGGGIGTRGPGETKLETDRRHIGRRITSLKRNLAAISGRRHTTRRQRTAKGTLTAAVVGYTNAGKSSLLNALCDSELEVIDQVFATLDPAARRLSLKDGQQIILIDTVGFIRRLPHHLVEAFKSTLEEVTAADIVLQVTDASDPQALEQIEVVNDLLRQLKAHTKPRILVLNKIDLVYEELQLKILEKSLKETIPIRVSALTGAGLDNLHQELSKLNEQNMIAFQLLVPYKSAALLDYIRKNGIIEQIEYKNRGIKIKGKIKAVHYSNVMESTRLAQEHGQG